MFPGEHDFSLDDGEQYKQRFGKGTLGSGWYSHDHKGVHFVGLNNCVQVTPWATWVRTNWHG